MKRRSARSTDTRGASDDTDHAVLSQEVVRLRAQLREARAATAAEARGQARREIRAWATVAIVTALLIGGLVGRLGFAQTTTAPTDAQQRSPALHIIEAEGPGVTSPEALRVYVSGAVAEARVVEVPAGSLVADALELAGGATSDADLDTVNLAAPVDNNQHIVIPRLAERAANREQDLTGKSPPEALININTASCDDLTALPDIGSVRAADIVSYRTQNGLFERIEDIVDVPGIGPATYDRIAHLITVED